MSISIGAESQPLRRSTLMISANFFCHLLHVYYHMPSTIHHSSHCNLGKKFRLLDIPFAKVTMSGICSFLSLLFFECWFLPLNILVSNLSPFGSLIDIFNQRGDKFLLLQTKCSVCVVRNVQGCIFTEDILHIPS